jgi:hypothetical protein
MMFDDVAAVETVARPATRSPDTKAAVAYLVASGATAISVVEHDGVCSFHVGSKIEPRAVSIQWVLELQARAIVKQGPQDRWQQRRRRHGGERACASSGGSAGDADTARYRDLARRGLSQTARRLYRKSARTRCNEGIHQSVSAAALGGSRERPRLHVVCGAELRLPRALIPLLMGGRTIGPTSSLFAEIFE